jgi:probable rRNA maturation factor
VRIAALGVRAPLPADVVRRVVQRVLAGEHAGPAALSVTFLSSQRMRAAHRRALGRDRATDVLAFGMRHGPTLVGDIYVCPPAAGTSAARFGVPLREELVRLVVHGTLHALGWDHPVDARRTGSPMWRRQERYVRAALRTAAS